MMPNYRFSESALIDAPPQNLYAILADYHRGHASILPKPPFVDLTVEQGGIGEGTIIRVRMRVLGLVQAYRAVVTEPDPGRVLVETNENGYVTSFIVEPHSDGQHTNVTIATELPARTGVPGAVERWLMPRMLRPVYQRELAQLAEVAAAGPEGS
ncbi:MAG TPA: SRPBCC family protein [Longimicrobiales bacterium]